MSRHLIILLTLIFALAAASVAAEEKVATELLKTKLGELIPGATPDSIKPSVVDGLYEVAYGAQIFYLSADGRYVLRGNLIDVQNRTNLTESAKASIRGAILNSMDEGQMIVYEPENTKHTLTIFTDIDCPYCRRLHAEMGELNDLGIKVRYLAFPRTGVDTPSYHSAVSVWCAKDSAGAMTRAKNGEDVEAKTCENPVKDHMALGDELGVTGTPAIYLESGDLIPGYRPAKELASALDRLAAAN
ncbi:MAG: DsbC family protein [Gammaproteobacteria bacterium]